MRATFVAIGAVLAVFAVAVLIISDESAEDAPETSFTFKDARADGHITRAEWVVAAGLRDEQIEMVCDLSPAEAKDASTVSVAELEPICGDLRVPPGRSG